MMDYLHMLLGLFVNSHVFPNNPCNTTLEYDSKARQWKRTNIQGVATQNVPDI